MNKLQQVYQLWKNMGPHYLWFRAKYEYRRTRGHLEKKYPTNVDTLQVLPLHQWQTELHATFFIDGREHLGAGAELDGHLKERVHRILNGETLFFSKQWKHVAGWHTHPVTGYEYDKAQHWTKVIDLDPNAGDIKYVWERARFSFLYDVMRYDFHSGEDHAEWVFQQMESWINENPLNLGPHYKCSQEIALRVLNWMYALHFYKYSLALTEARWELFLNSMYRQIEHVYTNIEFSRIAVRNNHAITECLGLYAFGLVFPFFKASKKWKVLGKRWLEEEIAYQFYKDGTYIQHSMNYQRVAAQLLCWTIRLSQLNKQPLLKSTLQRAEKTFNFLLTCQDTSTGQLPNYGSNDGALFFPFTNCDYRDYRPLLNSLSWIVENKSAYETGPWSEEAAWYGFDIRRVHRSTQGNTSQSKEVAHAFQEGGIAVYKNERVLMLLKSGAYKDRPAQSDNLHFDLWVDGKNILLDTGSYLYNTDEATIQYFNGSKGHNTFMIEHKDHMLKGPRFIWWYWIKQAQVSVKVHQDKVVMKANTLSYLYLHKPLLLSRTITFYKETMQWEIEDECEASSTSFVFQQVWHVAVNAKQHLKFMAQAHHQELQPSIEVGYYASYYGLKENCEDVIFKSTSTLIKTSITYQA
jgi:hypothetical protein